MKNLTFTLLGALLTFGCTEDKEIESEEGGFDQNAETDADADADADADGAFVPVAIGIEFNGIWDEANNELRNFVYPGELTEDGEPMAASAHAVVTLATMDYFSATTDAEKEGEYCSWVAWFVGAVVGGETTDPQPYDMNAQEFDWDAGVGGSGVLVDEWTAWEGGLLINEASMDERCADWEGADYNQFHGLHYGLGFGDLSSFMTDELTDTDWWDDEVHPHTFFTMYTAMNHPNEESANGYDFVGYDFTRAQYAEVDESVCADFPAEEGEEAETVCGAFVIEWTDETETSYYYEAGDFRENVGERYAFVSGSAWWYEDFPNLDLSIMTEGFEWTD